MEIRVGPGQAYMEHMTGRTPCKLSFPLEKILEVHVVCTISDQQMNHVHEAKKPDYVWGNEMTFPWLL